MVTISRRTMFELIAIVAALAAGWGLASIRYRGLATEADEKLAAAEDKLRECKELRASTDWLLKSVMATQTRAPIPVPPDDSGR
jgi:hypothetical protein